MIREMTCDFCGEVPDVDPETDEYDLNQMCYVGGTSAPWWCSECAEFPKFSNPPCPEEFLDVGGNCRICD